jgi:hypothetical protein
MERYIQEERTQKKSHLKILYTLGNPKKEKFLTKRCTILLLF